MEIDSKKQTEMTEEYLSKTVAPHIQMIESHLKKNGSGYLVGSEVKHGINMFMSVIWSHLNLFFS